MVRFVTTQALALYFVVLNVLDAFLTTRAIANGTELNPILRPLIGSPMFWVFKVGLTLLFVGILLLLSSKYPKQIHTILRALAVCMVGVCLINTITLL
jgi:hypothetical protein